MHRIIALWCHPRSMSTSVERIMRERGDLECLHEPFMYHYYLNQKHRDMPYFEPKQDHPVTYEGVRDMIMEKAQASPVFFKDMAYYINSDIITDSEFFKSVTHCFLIRNPEAAIASYYKLDKDVTLPEIGIEAQWQVYSQLVDSGINPVVIQAESIRKDPRSAVNNWWERIDLVNKDAAFEWGDKSPEDWQQVKAWHQKSMKSNSINPWTEEDTQKEQDRFKAVLAQAPHLRSYLEHHMNFYERLKNESL